jgi:hypothetical protein
MVDVVLPFVELDVVDIQELEWADNHISAYYNYFKS